MELQAASVDPIFQQTARAYPRDSVVETVAKETGLALSVSFDCTKSVALHRLADGWVEELLAAVAGFQTVVAAADETLIAAAVAFVALAFGSALAADFVTVVVVVVVVIAAVVVVVGISFAVAAVVFAEVPVGVALAVEIGTVVVVVVGA